MTFSNKLPATSPRNTQNLSRISLKLAFDSSLPTVTTQTESALSSGVSRSTLPAKTALS